jgi:hypothetical protein
MRARALAVLVFACLSVSGQPAGADDKKVCADAYVAAQSLRADHRLLAARAQLRICANTECDRLMQGQMIKDCTAWLGEVEASIPTVVLSATDADGNELQNVKVSIDGTPVAEALDGRAVEVEPGSHVFAFAGQQGASATQTAVILEGARNQSVHVTLGTLRPPPAPPSAAAMPSTAGPPPVAPVPRPESPATSSDGSAQRALGVVAGGAGLAALAAGVVFGMLARSAKTDYEKHCGSAIGAPAGFCDSQGISGHTDASNKATLSTAFVIGGGVALGAGAVIFLTAPHGTAGPQVGVGPGGVVVRGGF